MTEHAPQYPAQPPAAGAPPVHASRQHPIQPPAPPAPAQTNPLQHAAQPAFGRATARPPQPDLPAAAPAPPTPPVSEPVQQPLPQPGAGEPAPSAAASGPQARALGRLVHDRRRHQRVAIPLEGRFMRADKQEYPCRVINMSPGGIALHAEVSGLPGERIVLYLEHMGRFEGELVRTFPGGFAVRLIGTAYKREKIANQLTWLINKDRLNLAEDREHERQVPFRQQMKLVLADGTEQQCRILDVSLGGASVAISPLPEIGTAVTLGLIRGTVVRHHDQGIGVRFLETQDPATIERQFS
ncbi:MAG: PilZ domain-containing protein [Alphaproteobacteria bacterium]|nr:MAG: PilZ domain-containing protein [Alphaproteobacteria bacterium]